MSACNSAIVLRWLDIPPQQINYAEPRCWGGNAVFSCRALKGWARSGIYGSRYQQPGRKRQAVNNATPLLVQQMRAVVLYRPVRLIVTTFTIVETRLFGV